MSESVWPLEPYQKQPVHPEQGVELAYTIPYEWGNLYMSEAAKIAYGLIPLTPDAQKGRLAEPRTDSPRPGFDITLVGPDEFYVDGQRDTQSGALRVKRQYNANGIELKLGFSEDTAGVNQRMQSMMKHGAVRLFGLDMETAEEELERAVDDDGIPIIQSLEQQAPQVFIHGLCSLIEEVGASATNEWADVDLNKQFYRKMKVGGAFALAGTGVVVSLPALLSGELHLSNLVLAGAYATMQANTLRIALRNYLTKDGYRRQITQQFAIKHASAVAADIHDSFCRHAFDQKMEERFDEA